VTGKESPYLMRTGRGPWSMSWVLVEALGVLGVVESQVALAFESAAVENKLQDEVHYSKSNSEEKVVAESWMLLEEAPLTF
jgi:hypothetical protein